MYYHVHVYSVLSVTNNLIPVAQGVVDFVWLPVQHYQQDGRVVRGLQKGASSLATSTGMATVELTTRLVQTIEVCWVYMF